MGSIGLFPGIKHKLKLKDHTVNTHWTENTLLKTSAKPESHQGQIFIDVDSININSTDQESKDQHTAQQDSMGLDVTDL